MRLVIQMCLSAVILLLIAGCGQVEPTSEIPISEEIASEPVVFCKVEREAEYNHCNNGSDDVWVSRQMVCVPGREVVITESVECYENQCLRQETVEAECKTYGDEYICGYETSQDKGDAVCTNPQWTRVTRVWDNRDYE